MRALRIDRMQALTLGVVSTRLRYKYGSMQAARKHWEDEAIEQLFALESPLLRDKLFQPATQAIAFAEIQEIIERDHALFLLLRRVLGWNLL